MCVVKAFAQKWVALLLLIANLHEFNVTFAVSPIGNLLITLLALSFDAARSQ